MRPTGEGGRGGTGLSVDAAKRPVRVTYSPKALASSFRTRWRVQSSRRAAMRATFTRRSRRPSGSTRSSSRRSTARISSAVAEARGLCAKNRRGLASSGNARCHSLPRAEMSLSAVATDAPVFATTVGHEKLAVSSGAASIG